MLKIGYFADGPWAHKALEKIVADDRLEIAYIVVRYDSEDGILVKWAKNLGIPLLRHRNVNSTEFIDVIKQYGVDINVSMSFNQILRDEIINLAPQKFINCHAGALPFYRGRNILNWVLINGENRFGVTVHYVDSGIDTGDIILQQFADITCKDRYGDLLEKAYVLCADTLYKALIMIYCGNVQPIAQTSIHPVGFYCSRRVNGDERINWNWSSQQIYNFVRGIAIPAPGARVLCSAREYILDEVEMIEGAPFYIDKPGNIVGKTKNGIVIKTGDSTIHCISILDADTQEPIDNKIFKIGMRFL